MPKQRLERRVLSATIGDDGIPTGISTARALAAALNSCWSTPRVDRQTGSSPFAHPIHPPRDASPTPIRFPPDNFKHSFDSFFQSSFHLSLAVLVRYRSLRLYLALDGFTARLGLHSQTTRLARQPPPRGAGRVRAQRGLSPLLWRPFPGDLGTVPPLRTLLQTTMSNGEGRARFSSWGFSPVRSPLLGESL
ncbi:Uncharacterized protein Adt_48585 [Abeliophyllum distichum]|uniref:Uncharacterized protein n=1 Tax=Abeliophyllum distichum TaxID=126358 RepID=A0ABD1NQK7_9LAMI